MRRTGTETSHGNAGVAQFVGDGLGEREYVRLAGVVNGHQRPGLKGRGGGDIHDSAGATMQHPGKEEAGEFREGRDVEVDLAEGLFFRYLREFAEDAVAGIVNENVDRGALELTEEELGRERRREIEGNSLHMTLYGCSSAATCASLSALRATSTRL